MTKTRPNFSNIFKLNKKIINSLKTQKLRQDQMMEKYENGVKDEIKIPSNRFISFVKPVETYMDAVISARIMDQELIKQYETFLKEIVNYESVVADEFYDAEGMKRYFDYFVETIIKLEKSIYDLKKSNIFTIKNIQSNAQKLRSGKWKSSGNNCKKCGIRIDPSRGDQETECAYCIMLSPTDNVPGQDYEDNSEIERNIDDENDTGADDEEKSTPEPTIIDRSVEDADEDTDSTKEDDDDYDENSLLDEDEKNEDTKVEETPEKPNNTQAGNKVEKSKPINEKIKDIKIKSDFRKLLDGIAAKYDIDEDGKKITNSKKWE